MRVAVVCDTMSAYGGAERVIEQMLAVFPEADIFTVLDAVPKAERRFLEGHSVTTSFLQGLPYVHRYYRKLLHLWSLAVEQLDVTPYDLVISSHHSVANGVITRPFQCHVSYVHSPMRYAWDLQHEYLRESKLTRGPMSWYARGVLQRARLWDFAAAQRPDAIAVNSHFVAERVRKFYGRPSTVVYPPVDVEAFPMTRGERGGYYVTASRLVPYKRVNLVAEAFARMPDRKLKIIGSGPDLAQIRAQAAPNVEVLGWQPGERLLDLVSNAEALIFGGVEDFGISLVEAQAAGTPVIAFADGGAVETVLDLDGPAPTGILFEQQNVDGVVDAIERFEASRRAFRPENCRRNAERFSQEIFRDRFRGFVHGALDDRRARTSKRASAIGLRSDAMVAGAAGG